MGFGTSQITSPASLPTIQSTTAIVSSTGPGATPLSLGAVTFNSSECPEMMPIGSAEQMLVVHSLIGGGRVVNDLGVAADEVSWSGNLFDANIRLRVQQLRLYLVAGQEILMTWGAEKYYCKIKKFTPRYMGGHAAYDLTVVITRDANGAFTTNSALSIDQQVQALQILANGANNAILAPLAPVNLSSTALPLPTINPAALAAAKQAASYQSALSKLNQVIQQAGPIAQNIATAGPGILGAANLASLAVGEYISQIGPTSPAFANATLIQSSVNAITQNVYRGQSPQNLLLQGVSYFKLASLKYGDPSQAFSLAAANGSPSPFTSSHAQTNVSFPPLPSKP